MRIDSTANERVKAVRRLRRGRERRQTRQTLVEGPILVAAALEAGIVPVDVYVPGCPPGPQSLMHGILTLQDKIMSGEIRRSTGIV